MAKKHDVVDPLAPYTAIEIGGKTYKMCITYGALAKAEEEFNALGGDVTILALIPRLNRLTNAQILFAASLRRYHPEVTFEDAKALVDYTTVFRIVGALSEAFEKAIAPPASGEPGNPLQPEQ